MDEIVQPNIALRRHGRTVLGIDAPTACRLVDFALAQLRKRSHWDEVQSTDLVRRRPITVERRVISMMVHVDVAILVVDHAIGTRLFAIGTGFPQIRKFDLETELFAQFPRSIIWTLARAEVTGATHVQLAWIGIFRRMTQLKDEMSDAIHLNAHPAVKRLMPVSLTMDVSARGRSHPSHVVIEYVEDLFPW